MANRSIVVGGGGDPALMSELRRLRDRLGRLRETLRRGDPAGDQQTKGVQAEVEETQRRYEKVLARIRNEHPELTDFVEVRPMDPADMQRLLPEDVAVVAYYVTDVDTMVWVMRRQELIARRIPLSRKQLGEQVHGLRRSLEQFAPVDDELASLYKSLIEPVAAQLSGVRALGVIPHDALHYLPFAALLDQSGRYLVDRFELFSAPSVSVLEQLRQRAAFQFGPQAGALVLGNPDRGDESLALPFAEREAKSIGFEQPGGQVFVGAAAQESLMHEEAGTAAYLHLACHGTFQPASPLFSSLLLAAGKEQDGDLTAIEVFSLPLSARLVTLSACQTGLGSWERGDELVGFNRAFLAAGAGGVLSSLWRVSDVATAVLMKRFYRYLREDSPAGALRKAQRLVRRYHAHPAYWAGFVLVSSW